MSSSDEAENAYAYGVRDLLEEYAHDRFELELAWLSRMAELARATRPEREPFWLSLIDSTVRERQNQIRKGRVTHMEDSYVGREAAHVS